MFFLIGGGSLSIHAQITKFGWQTYNDGTYTLKYPNTWIVEKPSDSLKYVKLVFKFNGSMINDLNGNATIARHEIPKEYSTISEFSAILSIALMQMEGVISDKTTETSNELGNCIVTDFNISDKNYNPSAYMMQAVWKYKNEFWVLTLTQAKKKTGKTRRLFLQMVDSFNIH